MQQTPVIENQFYAAYDRSGQGCILKGKHIRQFDKDFAEASGFDKSMSVLELGCGNGLFLRFLHHRGVAKFIGIDGDPRVLDEMPVELRPQIRISDFATFFSQRDTQEVFDRVVMFDVLEHFSPTDGANLLRSIIPVLAPGGKVVVRTPNMASPWGLGVQYNDVTHCACYTPGSLRQVAKVAGFRLVEVRPQAYGSRFRELREGILTGLMSWFLAAPPQIWSPNLIAVFEPESAA